MLKFIFTLVLLLSGMLVIGQSTFNIDQIQKKQSKRISQGVKSGELTTRESHELIREQKLIQLQKRMAKSDGIITKLERARIKESLANAEANIYRKKHNGVNRS